MQGAMCDGDKQTLSCLLPPQLRLRLPSPPRAVICLWDTLLLPCFSSSVTFKEGNPESLSKSEFLNFITVDIRVR